MDVHVKRAVSHAARLIWILVGVIALVLGTVGIFVPLLPTTPFLILAAFAFANSSNRLHTWLVEHDIFGPLISNWRRYGSISRPAKIAALLSMFAVIGLSIVLQVPASVIFVQVLVLSAVALFIVSRPLPPEQ